eukprot:CAMPEP_0175101394 /NCGR_PEP_ID=MMETSP0086_2-20121207/7771_1 /TAXON_ID=136419 /ORGANISM="Unknown Unknown, Strain D1" /LENGTH=191 /DNA_ID=CAMNT_0016375917 /DNA_START=54 /DNA_END=630 /DNA_ORIENTATION=+
MSGVTVKDVDPTEFIKALAAYFKQSGKIDLPDWHDLVKTATFPPEQARENMSGVTVKDVDPTEFIKALAAYFKQSGKIDLPDWHDLVKTATHKEMCPIDPDWYYIRAASLARKVYIRGGTGVGAFKKVYGGRSRQCKSMEHFNKACGGLIRHILKQLGEMEIVEVRGDRKGRWLTKNGQRQLDTIAGQIAK